MFQLKNTNLKISIDHPLENYNFSRFDWTGKITKVSFKNILVSTTERKDGSNEVDFGKAFYNEFGMDTALGFEDAEIGGWFHKIGIGLLRKDGDQYIFSKKYEVKPAEFEIDFTPEKLIIKCTSQLLNGYAYELTKGITLHDYGFSINYDLKNLGEKDIHTEEYCHNFLAINKELINPNYKLLLPFQVQPDLFGDAYNPDGKVIVGKNEFKFNGTPKKQFFYSNLSGAQTVNAVWNLININSKIGISEKCSFKTDTINLWGWEHVISPELFYKIELKPGEETTWTRTFNMYEID